MTHPTDDALRRAGVDLRIAALDEQLRTQVADAVDQDAKRIQAQAGRDEPPPDVPVYQMPDGGTMWGTWEAGEADQQPDRLAAVMAYCAAHPYDGPEPDVQPLYFEQRYDYDTDTRTVSTPRGVPEFTEIAAFFLEDDDSIVRFEDDAVVFPVQPLTLRYRPLYARITARTIVLQRIDEEEA